MPGIDQTLTFRPLNIAILTVSDTRTLETDKSGTTLQDRAESAGHRVVRRAIHTDDIDGLVAHLNDWIDHEDIDVILTTGGTGVTGRDVTPEAVEAVGEKHIPGFGELFRWLSYKLISTSTIQSRATAVVSRGPTSCTTWLSGSLSRYMGRYPGGPTRHPTQALQLCGAHPPTARTIDKRDADKKQDMRGSQRFGAPMIRTSLVLSLVLSACGGEEPSTTAASDKAKTAPAKASDAYTAKQDPIVGDKTKALLLSQAWFMKDAAGKSKPGPARLEIWREGPQAGTTRGSKTQSPTSSTRPF